MKILKKIKEEYTEGNLTSVGALEKIFEVYLPDKQLLEENGLTIEHHGYGAYHLKQRGVIVTEASKVRCKERAYEVIRDKEKWYTGK